MGSVITRCFWNCNLFRGESKDKLVVIVENEDDRKKALTDLVKVVGVVLIPIVALMIFTTIALTRSANVYTNSRTAQDTVKFSLQISDLIGNIQRQRGLTAMFLSSNYSNFDAGRKLSYANTDTLTGIITLSNWYELFIPEHAVTFKEKNGLFEHIREYNTDVFIRKGGSLEDAIKFYTDINMALLNLLSSRVSVPEYDRILVALDALLRAADAVGIQRALGAAFWSNCRFPDESGLWFPKLQSEEKTYLDQLFRYNAPSLLQYEEGLSSLDPLQANLRMASLAMTNKDYASVCLQIPLQERFDRSDQWFSNVSAYMGHLVNVKLPVVNLLLKEIGKTIDSAETGLIIYGSVMVLVLGTSVVTLYMIYKMTAKIQQFSRDVMRKTEALEEEKVLTDKLLYQMMPRSVADILRNNGKAESQYYECVTIFFSDVDGFSTISCNLNPNQVCELLNALYNLIDNIIDNYDVYKVETIGDSYMIASGLPRKNGDNHAVEIALSALQIVHSVSHHKFPHVVEEGLKIRVGIHSGPVAAGVVGLKMPRYCLFGDTINTASRMQTNSEACKIHLSERSCTFLENNGGFKISDRGLIKMKGKGEMRTYWLDSTTHEGYRQRIHSLNVQLSTPNSYSIDNLSLLSFPSDNRGSKLRL